MNLNKKCTCDKPDIKTSTVKGLSTIKCENCGKVLKTYIKVEEKKGGTK